MMNFCNLSMSPMVCLVVTFTIAATSCNRAEEEGEQDICEPGDCLLIGDTYDAALRGGIHARPENVKCRCFGPADPPHDCWCSECRDNSDCPDGHSCVRQYRCAPNDPPDAGAPVDAEDMDVPQTDLG